MLGGYRWAADLATGERVEQVNSDGQEISVNALRGKPVVAIHLVPLDRATHAPITIQVQEGEDWLKFWRRYTHLNVQTGVSTEGAVIDVAALKPRGRTRKPVFVYVYPDGSILLTTDKEAG